MDPWELGCAVALVAALAVPLVCGTVPATVVDDQHLETTAAEIEPTCGPDEVALFDGATWTCVRDLDARGARLG